MVLERCQVHEPDPDDDGFGRCTCAEGAPDCSHNRITIDRAQGTETCEDCGAENPQGALEYIRSRLVDTGRTSARAKCTCGAGSDEDCGGPHDHIPPCPASQPIKGSKE